MVLEDVHPEAMSETGGVVFVRVGGSVRSLDCLNTGRWGYG